LGWQKLADEPLTLKVLRKDAEERRQFCRFFEELEEAIEINHHGGVSFVVKGEWGTGKTTYLKLLKEKLNRLGCKTLFFEAWRHKHDLNYFQSLLLELKELTDDNRIKAKITFLLKNIMPSLMSEAIRRFSGINVDIKEVFKGLLETDGSLYKQNINNLKNIVDAIMSEGRSKKCKFNRLFILIDDLDRLLPEDAFSMLETLRFYFNLENVAVVMGVNDANLEKYIKGRFNIEEGNFLERVFFFYFKLKPSSINFIHLRNFKREEAYLLRSFLENFIYPNRQEVGKDC